MKKIFSKNAAFIFGITLLNLILSGCFLTPKWERTSQVQSGGGAIVAQNTGGTPPPPAAVSPFKIKLQSQPESGISPWRDEASWEIAASVPTYPEDQGWAPEKEPTFSIKIPESRMYYSKFKFLTDVDPNVCYSVVFTPFIYRMSDAVSFRIQNGSAYDCSGNAPPAGCFNGFGLQFISDFNSADFVSGTTYSIYYLPGETRTSEFAVTSSPNQMRRTKGYTNRYMANGTGAYSIANIAMYSPQNGSSYNDPVFKGRDIAISGSPLYQGITFTCNNIYEEAIYRAHIELDDIDTVDQNGAYDSFYTWEEH